MKQKNDEKLKVLSIIPALRKEEIKFEHIPAEDAPLEDILDYLDFTREDHFDESTTIPVKVKRAAHYFKI